MSSPLSQNFIRFLGCLNKQLDQLEILAKEREAENGPVIKEVVSKIEVIRDQLHLKEKAEPKLALFDRELMEIQQCIEILQAEKFSKCTKINQLAQAIFQHMDCLQDLTKELSKLQITALLDISDNPCFQKEFSILIHEGDLWSVNKLFEFINEGNVWAIHVFFLSIMKSEAFNMTFASLDKKKHSLDC